MEAHRSQRCERHLLVEIGQARTAYNKVTELYEVAVGQGREVEGLWRHFAKDGRVRRACDAVRILPPAHLSAGGQGIEPSGA